MVKATTKAQRHPNQPEPKTRGMPFGSTRARTVIDYQRCRKKYFGNGDRMNRA
jgi:hypothetical protein